MSEGSFDPSEQADRLLDRAEIIYRQLPRLAVADADELPGMRAMALQQIRDLRALLDHLARCLTAQQIAEGGSGGGTK